jgi:hypothetical protein
MAKDQKDKAKKTFESLSWDKEFLAKQRPINFAELDALLDIFFCRAVKGDSFLDVWDPDFNTAWCPVLIGEAGVGKSTVVKQWARRHEFELRRIRMGDSMEEDNLGVFKREYDDQGHHQFTLPNWMPVDEPKGKGGIAFIDECGTGTHTHQNMIATLLTDGYDTGYYGHQVEKGWFWIAATNPDGIQYHLNQQLDKRVRDRMFPLWVKPKPEEVLHYLGTTEKLPDLIYGFMMMNKGMIDLISPRKWEMLGAFAFRWLKLRSLNRSQFLNTMRLNMPTGMVESLSKYMERGNDPSAYPMLAKDIMDAATQKEHEAHIARMRSWAKDGSEALIGATSYDIASYFGDPDIEMGDSQTQRMAGVIETIPKTDLIQTILDAATGTGKSPLLVKHLKTRAVAEQLAKLMDRHTQHQQAAGM